MIVFEYSGSNITELITACVISESEGPDARLRNQSSRKLCMSVAHDFTGITRLILYIKDKFDIKIMSPFSSEGIAVLLINQSVSLLLPKGGEHRRIWQTR